MSLELIKKQAQTIIEMHYNNQSNSEILNLVKEMKKKIDEERKKYV